MTRPRIVLHIAWYLVKNRAINPFLKKRSGQILLVLMTGLFLINSLQYLVGAAQGRTVLDAVRPYLHGLGLDHCSIAVLISGFLIIYTIYTLVRGKPIYLREEEYEVLLSQPISLDEFMLANIISILVSPLVLAPAFFGLALFGMVFTGDPIRGVLVMFGGLILLSGAIMIEILFKLAVRKTGHKLLLIIMFIALLAAGITHSLIAGTYSLILGIPYMPIAASLVYPFSKSVSLAGAIAVLLLGYVEISGLSLVASVLSRRIDIEDLSPRSIVNIKLVEGGVPRIRYGSPRSILYSYLFTSRILGSKHILGLTVLLSVAGLAGLATRGLLGVPGDTGIAFIEFFIPMMIGMALYSLSSHVLAMDLRCYWLYRTYVIDMAPVAGAIISKLAVNSVEAAAIMLLGLSLYMNKIRLLLMIPYYLPAGIAGAALQLITLSYLASKRQVIRETTAGIYSVEGLTAVLLEVIVIAVFMGVSSLAFYLSGQPLPVLVAGGIISIIVSYPLLRFVERIIGDIMTYYDVLI